MRNDYITAEKFIKENLDPPYQPTFRECADLMVKYAEQFIKPKTTWKKKGPHQVGPVNIDYQIQKHIGK